MQNLWGKKWLSLLSRIIAMLCAWIEVFHWCSKKDFYAYIVIVVLGNGITESLMIIVEVDAK